jgi:hypothetical protein
MPPYIVSSVHNAMHEDFQADNDGTKPYQEQNTYVCRTSFIRTVSGTQQLYRSAITL